MKGPLGAKPRAQKGKAPKAEGVGKKHPHTLRFPHFFSYSFSMAAYSTSQPLRMWYT